jgi:hypothetical protein
MRESPSGYHFYSLYLECPRCWYLKYVLGLKPRFTSSPLIFGGCLHEAIETYYKQGKDNQKARRRFEETLTSRKGEYEKLDKFDEDFARGPKMLDEWHKTWSRYDDDLYEVIEIEEEHEFRIGPNGDYLFTVRPDRVCRRKDSGLYEVFDVKTTSWSASRSFLGAEEGDQMTSYLWAMNKAHPDWGIKTAVIDVIYSRGKKVEASRPGIIYRTSFDFKVFELMMTGIIVEVSQKYKALSKYPWPLLFPPNGGYHAIFGNPYGEVHRSNIRPGEVPPGFVRDDWVDLDQLFENVKDFGGLYEEN